jgi:hypothetical protein
MASSAKEAAFRAQLESAAALKAERDAKKSICGTGVISKTTKAEKIAAKITRVAQKKAAATGGAKASKAVKVAAYAAKRANDVADNAESIIGNTAEGKLLGEESAAAAAVALAAAAAAAQSVEKLSETLAREAAARKKAAREAAADAAKVAKRAAKVAARMARNALDAAGVQRPVLEGAETDEEEEEEDFVPTPPTLTGNAGKAAARAAKVAARAAADAATLAATKLAMAEQEIRWAMERAEMERRARAARQWAVDAAHAACSFALARAACVRAVTMAIMAAIDAGVAAMAALDLGFLPPKETGMLAAQRAVSMAQRAAWSAAKAALLADAAVQMTVAGKGKIFIKILGELQMVWIAGYVDKNRCDVVKWKSAFKSERCPSCALHRIAKKHGAMQSMRWRKNLLWVKECVCDRKFVAGIKDDDDEATRITTEQWSEKFAYIAVADFFVILLPALIRSNTHNHVWAKLGNKAAVWKHENTPRGSTAGPLPPPPETAHQLEFTLNCMDTGKFPLNCARKNPISFKLNKLLKRARSNLKEKDIPKEEVEKEIEEENAIPRWESKMDPQGNTYYRHSISNASTYEKPDEFDEQEAAFQKRKAARSQIVTALERCAQPDAWTVHQDESGQEYYFNKRTGATTWEKPACLGDLGPSAKERKLAADLGVDLAAVAQTPLYQLQSNPEVKLLRLLKQVNPAAFPAKLQEICNQNPSLKVLIDENEEVFAKIMDGAANEQLRQKRMKPGWNSEVAPSGKTYYYNTISGESQWTEPVYHWVDVDDDWAGDDEYGSRPGDENFDDWDAYDPVADIVPDSSDYILARIAIADAVLTANAAATRAGVASRTAEQGRVR